MTLKELRAKLLEFFEANQDIDYDPSQSTKVLYRWAVRNHGFEKIDEFESKEKVDSQQSDVSSQKKELDLEKEPVKRQADETIFPIIEHPATKEQHEIKETARVIKDVLDNKSEPQKEDNTIWYVLGALLIGIMIYLFKNRDEDGND
jgi:hypothetical protein